MHSSAQFGSLGDAPSLADAPPGSVRQVAEFGDRTQIATVLLCVDHDPASVAIGAVAAFTAVTGGRNSSPNAPFSFPDSAVVVRAAFREAGSARPCAGPVWRGCERPQCEAAAAGLLCLFRVGVGRGGGGSGGLPWGGDHGAGERAHAVAGSGGALRHLRHPQPRGAPLIRPAARVGARARTAPTPSLSLYRRGPPHGLGPAERLARHRPSPEQSPADLPPRRQPAITYRTLLRPQRRPRAAELLGSTSPPPPYIPLLTTPGRVASGPRCLAPAACRRAGAQPAPAAQRTQARSARLRREPEGACVCVCGGAL